MKKLFTAILAIFALVACNRDYVVESLNPSVITFDDSFVEIKTRAAEDPSTTTETIEKFDVWGYMGSKDGVVFEQERVSKTANGWEYANLKYWMPNQNYYFAAVSPVDDANIKVNAEGRSFNEPTGIGVIEFTNENGTTDLLYAEKSLTTDEDATNEDKVHLQFAHMLSKVKFTFVNALPNEIEIKNIKINNAPKSASIDMTAETRAWANHTDELVLDFGDVEKGAKLANNGEKYESDYARLTLPVGGEYEYNITFDVYVYHGTEAGLIAHTTTLTDAEFMIGKAYNLTAIISPENLGLQPIEFTVEAVNEWVDGGEYDIYGPEGDDQEPETPVEPEEPEVKETKLYLQPNANWNIDNARFAAYMWNNSGDVWFDMTLVEGETNIYEFTLPEGYSNLIFCRMNPDAAANNWNNKWNQTGDLVVPADGMNMFVVPENAWDGATTGWATYTPATTPEEPVEPEVTYTSVAEFLAAPVDDATYYTLKGTITSVANTSYGNFDLTDETGTIYVYGLYSEDGATNKYWAASGAKLGDDIVISATRAEFNGSAQASNARFVELYTPGTLAFYTVDPAAVDFTSAGGEQDIEVFAYNTTAAVTATSDNSAFDVNVNGYVITVTAAANELEEAVTGNITIKVGDLEAKVVKVTLAAKPASGVVEGGSDDFNTISATNTSYVSGKTTAGWSYTSCAIFKGGTSDNSPAFKMIGDDSNRALCMNGKTSAVGKITSPTLTTGCGTLKFNYGLPFSDTKIKFRVDIIQNGAVVKTFTVDKSSASKVTKYSHEEVINVAGEFQIVFTNLSPSNSTSNKDRTAIWDVEWTGCN